MKPWLKILIVAVVVGLIGLGIYFVFKPQPLAIEDLPPTSGLPTGELPGSGGQTGGNDSEEPIPPGGEAQAPNKERTLSIISDREVSDFWVSNNETYYVDLVGKIHKAKINEDEEVSNQALSGPLNKIENDEKGNLVLISFGSPLSPSWTVFDSRDLAFRPLEQDIKLAAWGNKTAEIIAIKELPNRVRQLVFLDADKLSAAPKIILNDFRMESIQIIAAGNDSFLIQELPDSEYGGKIWILNTKTLTLNTLRDSASNQLVKKGNSNTFFVWSGGNNFEIASNSNLTESFPIPFSTLPQKCGVKDYEAFCFVPQDLGEETMSKFLRNEIFFRDSLYKINTLTEDFEVLNLEGLNNNLLIDGKNPQLAGDSVIFLNRLDKKLYQLTNFR
jgi:hypothetical protein